MLKETETEETIVFFVAFLSLAAIQSGGRVLWAPPFYPLGYAYGFSKLKMTKSYLRSTMNDDCLSALSILPIKRDYGQKLDFEDIIADFQ